ncbi:MAG: hypothetical protein Q607_CBUC00062G0018 [Clostridium butyricum DORA_1]|nr:MAG: hypothetical protein Q607_CBUC00062G0018 [Clostridium butyricum DORA_1]
MLLLILIGFLNVISHLHLNTSNVTVNQIVNSIVDGSVRFKYI